MPDLRPGTTVEAHKKDRERQLLRAFGSVYPHIPSGQLDDFERPDFVLSADEGTVMGVELVDYVRGQGEGERGSTELMDEKDHEAVVREAEAMFSAENRASVQVNVSWHPGRHLKKSHQGTLAAALAELVERNAPREVLEPAAIERDQLRKTPLRRFVADVFVTRLTGKGKGAWVSFESTWPEVGEEEIQRILDSKDEKVEGYREHVCQHYETCDAVWLVIVAEGRYAASLVDLSDTVESHRFRTSFDKAVFWDKLNRTVITLHESP